MRLAAVQGGRASHDLPHFAERRYTLLGEPLDKDVPQRRGLRRAGQDGLAGRVGGQLAKERVSRAADDDVDDFGRLAGKRFQPFDDQAVLERQALQNVTHDLAGGLRDGLSGRGAVLPDGARQVAGGG